MKLFQYIFLGLLLHVFFLFHLSSFVSAQGKQGNKPNERYYKAVVLRIIDEGEKDIAGYKNFTQTLEVVILEGNERSKHVFVEQGGIVRVTPQQRLATGDQIILLQSKDKNGKTTYSLFDRYRLDNIVYLIASFFVLVLLIAGIKGLGSIIGMLISLAVILKFIVPQILGGSDPLLISISGSLIIMVITIFLAHGMSKKTSVAVLSTFLSLLLTGILSIFFVSLLKLSGLGSEDSYLLQFGQTKINLQGLLLGGMIIGALGVLDDVTTTQTAAVFELANTNPKLTALQLIQKGFRIGKEHVASLVNTLVLAYAGASLGLFILFVLNPSHQPYWVILNSEVIVEEVVRTLAGSSGLVLAVPIATVLASWFARNTLYADATKAPRKSQKFRH